MADIHDLRGAGTDQNRQAGGGSDPRRAPEGFRLPPHNLQVEVTLLGALMVNNDMLTHVRDRLRPEHFYEPYHAKLYERTSQRILNGRLADVDALSAGLDERGRAAMLRLAQACVGISVLEVDQSADEIISLWQRRRSIEVGETLVNASYDLEVSLDEWRKRTVEELDQVEKATPRPPTPFEYIGHSDIGSDLPLRTFIVDKLVPMGCVTSLYGAGGSGKSFLAMMLAMCVASGRPWLGFPCTQAVVLAVMCEDDDAEIRRRRNKIAAHFGLSESDIANRLFITARVGEPNAMMEFPNGVATRTELFYRIVSEAKRIHARLVILDNAAQLFNGNENDRAQVTAFLNACAGIAREIDGAVLLLGHPPKLTNVEFSGSTAWDAVVRSRIWFKRIEAEDQVVGSPERYSLELVKSNYTKRFGIELQENAKGVVEYVGDLCRSVTAKKTISDRVFAAFRHMFETHRRTIAPDELVQECIHLAIYAECEPGSAAWRDKRFKIRANLMKHANQVDFRDDGYAIKL